MTFIDGSAPAKSTDLMFECDSLQVWSSVHRRSISTTIRRRYFVKWSLGIPVAMVESA